MQVGGELRHHGAGGLDRRGGEGAAAGVERATAGARHRSDAIARIGQQGELRGGTGRHRLGGRRDRAMPAVDARGQRVDRCRRELRMATARASHRHDDGWIAAAAVAAPADEVRATGRNRVQRDRLRCAAFARIGGGAAAARCRAGHDAAGDRRRRGVGADTAATRDADGELGIAAVLDGADVASAALWPRDAALVMPLRTLRRVDPVDHRTRGCRQQRPCGTTMVGQGTQLRRHSGHEPAPRKAGLVADHVAVARTAGDAVEQRERARTDRDVVDRSARGEAVDGVAGDDRGGDQQLRMVASAGIALAGAGVVADAIDRATIVHAAGAIAHGPTDRVAHQRAEADVETAAVVEDRAALRVTEALDASADFVGPTQGAIAAQRTVADDDGAGVIEDRTAHAGA